MNCPNCGGTIAPGANRCLKCGTYIEQKATPGPAQPAQAEAAQAGPAVKSKMTAGLLGIFLGWLGIHRFYLGYNGIGVLMLILYIAGLILIIPTCGGAIALLVGVSIWGLVEGILILAGSFDKDAEGRPLIQ